MVLSSLLCVGEGLAQVKKLSAFMMKQLRKILSVKRYAKLTYEEI